MRSGLWFCVRIVIVLIWAVGGVADRWPAPQLSALVSLLICLVCFGWGALATRFLVVLPYRKLPAGPVWLHPSWWVSPFHAEQPFQFFHLTGFSFLLFGLAAGTRTLLLPDTLPADLPAEVYVGLFGLGILTGMAWAARVFRDRFVAASHPEAASGPAQDSGISSVSSSG